MGSAYIPSHQIQSIEVGSTTVANPYPMLVVGGTAYPNGFRVNYAGGYRNIYASYDPANNKIYLQCVVTAYGEDLPAYTLSNVEIYVIGGDGSVTDLTPTAGSVTAVYGATWQETHSTDGYGNTYNWNWYANLSWGAVAYARKYRIYRYTGSSYVLLAETTSTGYNWTGVSTSSVKPAFTQMKITVIDVFGQEVNPSYFSIS